MSAEISSFSIGLGYERPPSKEANPNLNASTPVAQKVTSVQPSSYIKPLTQVETAYNSFTQFNSPLQETVQAEVFPSLTEQQAFTEEALSELVADDKLVIDELDELKEAIDDINSALYSYNKSLRFELHEETNELVVKVLNTKTDEIIRQYPSDEVLERRSHFISGEINFFAAEVY